MPVSILAHPGRWALPADLAHRRGWLRFQSSPTPEGGRYPTTTDALRSRSMFQSSPTPEGGRYTLPKSLASACRLFQSSPTPEGGRYRGDGALVGEHGEFQSSPTPEGGRYDRVGRAVVRFGSFNPRPPRKVGATLPRRSTARIGRVSILAHPGRWALPYGSLARATKTQFQSSPTPEGGRYSRSIAASWPASCFNPRPPRKVGATSARSTPP